MAEQGSEIHRRAIKLTTFAPPEGLELMKDLLDQYETVTHISDSQLRFLIGVTDFYRARTDTKMTIAAERLAVIAVLTLPITSLSSVMGMNVIVNNSTRWIPLIILLLIMLAISLILLRWARKQGWGDNPSSAACCRPSGAAHQPKRCWIGPGPSGGASQ
jgi:magnesium transporter